MCIFPNFIDVPSLLFLENPHHLASWQVLGTFWMCPVWKSGHAVWIGCLVLPHCCILSIPAPFFPPPPPTHPFTANTVRLVALPPWESPWYDYDPHSFHVLGGEEVTWMWNLVIPLVPMYVVFPIPTYCVVRWLKGQLPVTVLKFWDARKLGWSFRIIWICKRQKATCSPEHECCFVFCSDGWQSDPHKILNHLVVSNWCWCWSLTEMPLQFQ